MANNQPPGDKQIIRAMAIFTHIGLVMVLYIGGGILLGRWLDSALGTGNILLFLFLVLSIAGAFWAVYKLIMNAMK